MPTPTVFHLEAGPGYPSPRHNEYVAALTALAGIMEPLTKFWSAGMKTATPPLVELVVKFNAVIGHLKARDACPFCGRAVKLVDGLLPEEAHFKDIASEYMRSEHGLSAQGFVSIIAVTANGKLSASYLGLCRFLLEEKARGK